MLDMTVFFFVVNIRAGQIHVTPPKIDQPGRRSKHMGGYGWGYRSSIQYFSFKRFWVRGFGCKKNPVEIQTQSRTS